MKKHPVLVTAAVIVNEGKVLVTRRHVFSLFEAGKWEFPGGKVDFGEHPEEAMKRELREELGIEVETGPVYDIISHVYHGRENVSRHVIIIFYLCQILEGAPSSLDNQEIAWVPKEDLGSMPFVEGDIPLVHSLIDDSGVWEL